ncbi:C-C motif chemokine 20b [Maylandia zebra]|uniref:C-C motif chemokine 20-like n=2 Tax=Haplochromini TaxID=319058 RepID=A0A3Q2WRR8_HAPBU|nr:C-C motif chemokine 20b [Haplochromis burtoni]XP_012774797.1 C-C motif chemokine 20 [Maylandia zebra]XP_026035908.1 C-C motif chemokine 20-like [Astatotilapia calliptera]XP_039900100.1 C-C motif chemokine 20b [Simochromis diagramma]
MASRKTCLMVALCSLVIIINFFDSAQSASCCLRYSNRQPPCKRILGYTIQNINNACDINAIIFHAPGRFVCADPSKPLTQKVMKCYDEKKRKTNKENSNNNAS